MEFLKCLISSIDLKNVLEKCSVNSKISSFIHHTIDPWSFQDVSLTKSGIIWLKVKTSLPYIKKKKKKKKSNNKTLNIIIYLFIFVKIHQQKYKKGIKKESKTLVTIFTLVASLDFSAKTACVP